MSLPIISITPYLSPALDATSVELKQKTSAALHDACMKYGFFYLDISSYVDVSETDELTRLAREFFALPQEEKDRLSLKHEDHARGYARLHENVTQGKADNHEGLDLYRPVEKPDKTKPLWGSNQWPTVPDFRLKYEHWVDKMTALGMIVMEAMAVGLGMTANEWIDLRSKVSESFWVMRVIATQKATPHYSMIMTVFLAEHTKIMVASRAHVLNDPTPSALQVYLHGKPSVLDSNVGSASGGVWIDADPIPGCVVCNIGEMWETWTKGLYKSTLHRVIHKGSNYRVSIPFFFEPNFDALVEPLPAAQRILAAREEEEPETEGAIPRKSYKPVVYGQFLLKKVGANFLTGKGKYA